MERHNSITDVPGILVGHSQNEEAATGCTVIICEDGAVTGVDVRGGAPGTRELAALDPVNFITEAHAVYLGGGSAFGLDGVSGVMRYLEERGIGLNVGVAHVPIVPAAVLFDLASARADVRPDKEMGYQACCNASSPNTLQGNTGAGMGASIGPKSLNTIMKGGLGTASLTAGDLIVGALVAVNCFGDIIDPARGEIIAGATTPDKKGFINICDVLAREPAKGILAFSGSNTTIGIIATNAKLTKAEATKVAMMAHDGFARTINPIHTMYDGDSIFCMATGEIETDLTAAGSIAATVMAEAVLNGVKAAETAYGLLSYQELYG